MVQQAAPPLGRAPPPPGAIDRRRRGNRFGRRRGGEVFVEEVGPERRAPPLGQREDLDDLLPAAQGDPEQVRRQAPALEETRRPEPLVHADVVHAFEVYAKTPFPRWALAGAACPPAPVRPPERREPPHPRATLVPVAFSKKIAHF